MTSPDLHPGQAGPMHPDGRVWLVGAGPGDPELLSLKAARLLGQADVILVDDLVNPEVLVHAGPHARIHPVGKRGGCRSTPQAFINRLMLREARRGKRVVRLKGGDALVFGRANEEIDFLQAHGIAVELVAGITSAQAAGMALGRSLTDRAHSHGLVLLTGHPARDDHADAPGSEPVDMAALTRQGLTVVIYMGLSRVDSLQASLLSDGADPDLPAAIIENASRPQQRCLHTRLGELSACVRTQAVRSPALLVLGRIAQQANAALISAATAGLHPAAENPSGQPAHSDWPESGLRTGSAYTR